MYGFKNILVVRTDRIGDVVLTTPVFKALRLHFPASGISVLVNPLTVDLVRGNPYVDEVLVDDRQGRHQGLGGFLKLVHEIHLMKFDLAVIYHTKRRYNLACFLAGIPCRLGYKNNKFGFLLNRPLPDPRASGQKHEAQYCMDVLKSVGIYQEPLDLLVPVLKEAEGWVVQWMQEHKIKSGETIVLHPGSSDTAKCWPASKFAQLINSLGSRYALKIVFIGSQATVPIAQEILRQIQNKSDIIDLTGKTNLAQTAGLLKASRLLISNDSGPVHVAAGVGCNVISLFLRDQPGINPERWRPLGPRGHILVNKPGQGPGSFDVEDVLAKVEQIFHKDSQYEIF